MVAWHAILLKDESENNKIRVRHAGFREGNSDDT